MSKKSPVGEPVEDYLNREKKLNALRALHNTTEEYNKMLEFAKQSLDVSMQVLTDGTHVVVKIDGRELKEYVDA